MKKIDIEDIVPTLFISQSTTKWEEKVRILMIEGCQKGFKRRDDCVWERDGFILFSYRMLNTGADPGGKNMIFWRKIVIFHTKYPKNFRAPPPLGAIFLSAPPPLTWNPGSAPEICYLMKQFNEHNLIDTLNSVQVSKHNLPNQIYVQMHSS